MMKTTLPLGVKKYKAIVLLLGIFFCSFDQVKAQNVPQLTGWTFSRSFGNGMQKTSSAFSKSEAEIKGSVSGVNVIPLTSSGPDSSFLVVDPEKPFATGTGFTTLNGRSKGQSLSFFNLSDWGYSVFTF